MKNPFKIIYRMSKRVLKSNPYYYIFPALSIIILSIFMLLPVYLTPGNTLGFQLNLFTPINYVLMIILALLVSLVISMQLYNYRLRKSAAISGTVAVGGFSGITATIFGTASCASCVAAIFGFLGVGTVFFLIKYQWYIVSLSVIFLLLSLYFTSSSLEKNCLVCD